MRRNSAAPLEANSKELSPIHVEWRLNISPVDTNPAWDDSPAPRNPAMREPQEVDFFLDSGKYRFSEVKSIATGKSGAEKLKRVGKKVSFDGTRMYQSGLRTVGSTRGINTVTIRSGAAQAKQMPNSRVLRYNYFEFAGFWLPNRCADHVSTAVQSAILEQLANGGELVAQSSEVVEGHPCDLLTVAAADRHFKYYLDPKLHFALRRSQVMTSEGTLISEANLSDFRRLTEDSTLFLPWRCKASLYQVSAWPATPTATPLSELSFDVELIERTKIAPERFVLDFARAGTYVSDKTLPGAENTKNGFITYRYPADAADLDNVIREATSRSQRRSRVSLRMILLVGNIVVIVVVIGILLLRRRLTQT